MTSSHEYWGLDVIFTRRGFLLLGGEFEIHTASLVCDFPCADEEEGLGYPPHQTPYGLWERIEPLIPCHKKQSPSELFQQGDARVGPPD